MLDFLLQELELVVMGSDSLANAVLKVPRFESLDPEGNEIVPISRQYRLTEKLTSTAGTAMCTYSSIQ